MQRIDSTSAFTRVLLLLGGTLASTLWCTACAPRAVPERTATHAAPAVVDGSAPQPAEEDVVLARATAQSKIDRRADRARRGFKPFDQPRLRQEYYVRQRLAPGAEYPMDRMRRTLEEIKQREGADENGIQAGGLLDWTELGPGNVGGRTRALVFDPSNPSTMYAGGVAGGVWKSTDAGDSWNPTDDLMLNLAVSTIAIDPADSNVLYAGTGEGFLAGPSVRGLGIFKSTDAGGSWTQLAGTVSGVPAGAFHYVNKIRISPNDSNRIYAATRTGVWRSLDAGQSWQLQLANPLYLIGPTNSNGSGVGCTDLAIRSDRDPDVLWAAFGSAEQDGVFRSDDGGDTWIPYTTATNQGRMTFAFAPSNQDVLYILMADNGTGGQWGQLVNVFRTTDGGATFEARVNFGGVMAPFLLSNLAIGTGCIEYMTYSQGWYDNIIAVDPLDPDVIWVGGIDLFRSEDAGQNWGVAGYWLFAQSDPIPPYFIHPDFHAITFHPNYDGVTNQIMYAACDGGIFRTLNAGAAVSQEDCPLPPDQPLPEIVWENMNNGYGVTQFYHGDSARDGVDMFIGGAQDNGTNQVLATNTLDDWSLILSGDGGYVAIDPQDSQTIYAEIQFFPNFYKSTDGGASFNQVINGITDSDGEFLTPFAMNQKTPDVLWTGSRRPWRTTNGADLWEPAGPVLTGGMVSAVAIDTKGGDTVYLGFDNGFLARTTNANAPSPAWSVFGAANGLPVGAYVSSVAIDPQIPNRAYCTYSTFGVPHVFATYDGGQTWTSIDGIDVTGIPDIAAHWIEVRPCDSEQLYVGSELGVFASDDGGVTWSPANQGFANTVVESLDFRDDNTLVAYSHGRGAFLAQLAPCTSCAEDLDGTGDVGFGDILTVISAWGACAGCVEDLNGNGAVDFADIIVIIAAWGACDT